MGESRSLGRFEGILTGESGIGIAPVGEYTHDSIMATSVHIPPPLLDAIDRRARAQNVSRNRLILRALEREIEPGGDWSFGFFERLAAVEPEIAAAVDELIREVQAGRRSKKPVEL